MTDNLSTEPSSRKGLIGGVAFVALAAAIVVVFVLPSEFGIDPTGAGKALGLTEIANPVSPELERGKLRTGVLTLNDGAYAADPAKPSDKWVHEFAPFARIEFKYTLTKGQPIKFKWTSTGPLKYDMHAHPFDGGVDLTESYSQETAASMEGTYVPAFTGIHGWFWENQSADNVTLTLEASGDLTESTIFEGSGEYKRQIGAETEERAAPE